MVSKRYEHLLDADADRTDKEPFGAWCNEPDAEAWYAQATKVFGLQRSAWNALMRIENRNELWTHTDANRSAATAYEKAFDDLPAPSIWMAFGMGDCAAAVEKYRANIHAGVEVLEKLDEALIAYKIGAVGHGSGGSTGSADSGKPGTGADAKSEGGIGTLGVVAILGGAAAAGITIGALWGRRQRRAELEVA